MGTNFLGMSSESNANQKTITASDSAQNIGDKSTVAQGGSTMFGKGASAGTINLSGAKIAEGVTLNLTAGASDSQLKSLLGEYSTATAAQIAALKSSSSSAGTATTAKEEPSALQEFLSSDKIWWALAALGALFFLAKKRS
jgi:hypothetical protein